VLGEGSEVVDLTIRIVLRRVIAGEGGCIVVDQGRIFRLLARERVLTAARLVDKEVGQVLHGIDRIWRVLHTLLNVPLELVPLRMPLGGRDGVLPRLHSGDEPLTLAILIGGDHVVEGRQRVVASVRRWRYTRYVQVDGSRGLRPRTDHCPHEQHAPVSEATANTTPEGHI